MSKAEILECFKDINYAYNNCSMLDSLSNMLDELEQEIRNNAIDEFTEKLVTNVESFQAEVNGIRADIMTEDYFHEYVMEIAEQMKGVQNAD